MRRKVAVTVSDCVEVYASLRIVLGRPPNQIKRAGFSERSIVFVLKDLRRLPALFPGKNVSIGGKICRTKVANIYKPFNYNAMFKWHVCCYII